LSGTEERLSLGNQGQTSPRWPLWAGIMVVVSCLATIGATLNDIF